MNRGLAGLICFVLLLGWSGPLAWGQANQIQNGEFDDDLVSWGLYGAAGYTAEVVAGARLSGPNAALMDVTNASVTSVGISQGNLKFERGKTYPVGLMAKADKEREMVILIQLYKPEGPNWIDIVMEHVALTTEPQTFLFEYTHNDDSMADHPAWVATMYLMLKGQWWPMAGDTVASKVWVDRVHVGEQPPLLDSTVRHASAPRPADGAADVPRDTGLDWMPGEFIATHDVYFGETFADVNTADRANPMGVLVSQDQTDAQYDPDGLLEFGQTYYWRVDEVNAAPDNTIFTGKVWSFTVEPFSYPLTNVTATASSAQPGMGPENTINGSGLNIDDQHSTELTEMWMTANQQPHWIQYEFDAVYKLDELWVWNSNQLIEGILGFGAKNVGIEYSTDGETWTALEGASEFARATGQPTYTANTVVDFGSVEAKFVKITVDSTWGGISPQTGLSEVRFFYIPVRARGPVPANQATEVGLDAELNWRPGREATSHEVYFGADANTLTQVDTVTDHSYTPGALDLGTTYYWKVDEVGDTGTYEGNVWSFTTEDFAVVEDMESYNDDDNRIYDTWIDGLTDSALGGSQVGYDMSPFAEKTIVHGGSQSLPLIYNNAGTSLSEAELTLDQDWTASGIRTLSLYFRGAAGNTGQLYVKINDVKVPYDGPSSFIAATTWLPWNIDLSAVGANLSNVNSLTIGVEGAGAGGILYIDDVRLYPRAPEFMVPTPPDDADLVGHWTLDEGSGTAAGDSSGNGNNGTLEGAQWMTGVLGGALQFDGNSRVDCGEAPELALTEALSLTLWVRPANLAADRAFAGRSAADGGYAFKSLDNHLRFTTPGVRDHDGNNSILQLDAWQHVAVTFVPGQATGCVFYVNGLATDTLSSSNLAAGTGSFEIGHNHWGQWYIGMIDEVRVYDRVLSAEEVAALAGHTKPLHQPL